MRFFLALGLITATFAFVPSAEAVTCDPVVGAACVGSSANGTCTYGSQSNFVTLLRNDENGYFFVRGSTHCSGSDDGRGHGVGVSAQHCDPEFASCEVTGVYWNGGSSPSGSHCDSGVFLDAMGAINQRELPLCAVAGAPPVVPSLGLP